MLHYEVILKHPWGGICNTQWDICSLREFLKCNRCSNILEGFNEHCIMVLLNSTGRSLVSLLG